MPRSRHIESLETRLKLSTAVLSASGTVLKVTGDTATANAIVVSLQPGATKIDVSHNGTVASFDTAKLTKVIVTGGKLDDVITITADALPSGNTGATTAVLAGTSTPGVKFFVLGGDGADTIKSSAKFAALDGGLGNDKVTSTEESTGKVVIRGGAGEDTLAAGNGTARVDGGLGNDTITAGGGIDILSGGAGNDLITAGNGSNKIHGGEGNDTLIGGNGNNTLHGGAGNDTLSAGTGSNFFHGGLGNDTITGGSGTTVMYGGAGDDTEIGGSGTTTIYALAGTNSVTAGTGPTTVYLGKLSALTNNPVPNNVTVVTKLPPKNPGELAPDPDPLAGIFSDTTI